MALIVGTDSYLILADADTYLSTHHVSTDVDMVVWTALTDANCEALLRRATSIIDRLPLVGVLSDSTQTLAFPRNIYTEVGGLPNASSIIWDRHWYVQPGVPQAVKDAQCEIALSLCMGIPKRAELQRQGVKSFSLGTLSETYGGNTNDVLSYEAKQLLAPYLLGSARIC